MPSLSNGEIKTRSFVPGAIAKKEVYCYNKDSNQNIIVHVMLRVKGILPSVTSHKKIRYVVRRVIEKLGYFLRYIIYERLLRNKTYL